MIRSRPVVAILRKTTGHLEACLYLVPVYAKSSEQQQPRFRFFSSCSMLEQVASYTTMFVDTGDYVCGYSSNLPLFAVFLTPYENCPLFAVFLTPYENCVKTLRDTCHPRPTRYRWQRRQHDHTNTREGLRPVLAEGAASLGPALRSRGYWRLCGCHARWRHGLLKRPIPFCVAGSIVTRIMFLQCKIKVVETRRRKRASVQSPLPPS